MAEFDTEKNIYLFVHGRRDLQEKAENTVIAKGFAKEKIIMAQPNKVGEVGEYMAMLWPPPAPDQMKFQQITKIVEVEPEGVIGLWGGVSKDDIESSPFE